MTITRQIRYRYDHRPFLSVTASGFAPALTNANRTRQLPRGKDSAAHRRQHARADYATMKPAPEIWQPAATAFPLVRIFCRCRTRLIPAASEGRIRVASSTAQPIWRCGAVKRSMETNDDLAYRRVDRSQRTPLASGSRAPWSTPPAAARPSPRREPHVMLNFGHSHRPCGHATGRSSSARRSERNRSARRSCLHQHWFRRTVYTFPPLPATSARRGAIFSCWRASSINSAGENPAGVSRNNHHHRIKLNGIIAYLQIHRMDSN